jgi:5-methyltetrahydrofolate--homocysteine methyltransferase
MTTTPLATAIIEGNAPAAKQATETALASGRAAIEIVQSEMMPAMAEVGRLFEEGEYFVPELMLSARAMKGALELLRPLLAASGARSSGRVVIGTVAGDLHDIGKNLVAAMLEGGGFDITDLGTDVAPARFVEAVSGTGAPILCLSALLTVTMPSMKKTIEALEQAGIRGQVKVLVGGAPLSEHYAREIGADAYGDTASAAVTLARRFVAERA